MLTGWAVPELSVSSRAVRAAVEHRSPRAGEDAAAGAELLPPEDLAAEQAVLGAMLLSETAIGEVCEVLVAADFYRPAHEVIFRAVVEQFGESRPVDPVTIAAALERSGDLVRVGGAGYLHTVIAAVPTASNAGFYAERVREKAVARRLVETGTRISQLGYHGGGDGAGIDDVVDRAQNALDAVTGGSGTDAGQARVDELFDDQLAVLAEVQAGRVAPGLATPYADLTRVTGGWRPGQLIVVAGRPGLGKSTVAVDAARHAAFGEGQPVVLFSLEMSRTELWSRIVCAEARVNYRTLSTPHGLTSADWQRLDTARWERIAATCAGPLVIDDSASITMTQIRARSRRLKQKHGLGLVVVDYLQLMSSGRRSESRQLEISEFSRQLKVLAKELEVPVIALSQLNRGPEQRLDKRPLLSDLRESGAIEQDADMVILLHRPDAYDPEDARAGEADLILAKNRGGPTSTVTVCSQLHYCRFASLAS
ncbi:replicative DNA helicase [Pseudonocardia sp. ICBG1293]|uniref:replicative DNA helicase n=1 Tax=Pseudonocardia sp. ICBG1293 TaxID=2844382 RepID=UPI001CCB1039|nr:replicative DNA helicase [Pseudonocardia sp. ICBG1293]